jgi:DNA helicase II / ATP-dependent DNA helicase PcrA
MRFPPYADLDADQKALYADAPIDKALLVTGPPGTGKTVIAMHRATKLAYGGDTPVTILMFSKVLSRYTRTTDIPLDNIKITHLHDWVTGWYYRGFETRPPKLSQHIFDWPQITQQISECTADLLPWLNWGHLIVDEGQDFSPEMYCCFMTLVNHPLFTANHLTAPTLTVFADDNQTINENGSTLAELSAALNASTRNKRWWRLTKNYRNSREIAEFARYYQLSGASAAHLPEQQSGSQPLFLAYSFGTDYIPLIVNNAMAKDVGVIVFGTIDDVKGMYSAIKVCIEKKKKNYRLQMYSSKKKDRLLHNEQQLHFDQPPSITVVHMQSVKGLEFDSVFLVNMNTLVARDHGEIDTYKKLYVASSRARSQLFMLWNGGISDQLRLFPSPDKKLCTYKEQGTWTPPFTQQLQTVEWLPSATHLHRQKIQQDQLPQTLVALGAERAKTLLITVAERAADRRVLIQHINELDINNNDNLTDLILELGSSTIAQLIQEAQA